jgi:predicted permease
VTLAIGSSFTLLLFAVTEASLRPLPFDRPETLVVLDSTKVGNRAINGLSAADCRDILETTNAFSEIGVIGALELVVSSPDGAQRVQAGELSDRVIPMLGVRFHLGSGIPAGENRGSAVLSYGYWLSQYGGDPAAIGKTIRYNGNRTATIVGVLKPGFSLFPLLLKVEPLFYLGLPSTGDAGIRGNQMWTGIGRLRAPVTAAQAQQQLNAFSARAQAMFPRAYGKIMFRSRPLGDVIDGPWRRAFFFLDGVVFLVMAAAGANAAILFLIRAHSRRHQAATRLALGASPRDIVVHLFAESAIVSFLGILGSIALAYALTRVVTSGALAPLHIPRIAEAKIGAPVVMYAVGLAAAISAICAAASAWLLSGSYLRPLMGGEAGRRFFTGAGAENFVLFEVFIFMLLLVVGSAFFASYLKLTETHLGYDPHNALAMRITLPNNLPRQEQGDVLSGILARAPGIYSARRASAVYPLPCLPIWDQPFDVVKGAPGVTGTRVSARVESVDSGYFDTMRIPILRGRRFDMATAFGDPGAAIVSEAMASRWLGGYGIGSVLRQPNFGPGWTFEVVGVAANTRQDLGSAEPDSAIYVNRPSNWMYLILRGATLPEARSVVGAVRAADKNIAVDQVGMLDTLVGAPAAALRVEVATLAVLGISILAVLCTGLYSTVSLALHGGWQVLAIRAAVGATPMQLFWAVIQPFLRIAIGGILSGCIVGFVLVALLRGYIPELDGARASAVILSASLTLTITLGTASVAARKIFSLDPAAALRTV